MDKLYPSRTHQRSLVTTLAGILLALAPVVPAPGAVNLSSSEAHRIGRKIWQNECDGTISGLTSWNAGENFASLGIGHFIWYPKGKRGPFEESFPALVTFVSGRGAKLPKILLDSQASHCPWNSRAEFMLAQSAPDMKQLRQFLADTIDLQTQFLINRLDHALPKMLSEAAPKNRTQVEQRFQQLAQSANGCYALIDYVNFKGEGTLATERYHGEGWGLLQVLEQMQSAGGDPIAEFSRSAAEVLKRRVHNSPPARKESRWLSGWIHRVNSYSRG